MDYTIVTDIEHPRDQLKKQKEALTITYQKHKQKNFSINASPLRLKSIFKVTSDMLEKTMRTGYQEFINQLKQELGHNISRAIFYNHTMQLDGKAACIADHHKLLKYNPVTALVIAGDGGVQKNALKEGLSVLIRDSQGYLCIQHGEKAENSPTY